MNTLTYVTLIERQDGINLGFTAFNHDLIINGITYKASSAIDPTAVSQKADLSADNLEIKMLIDSEDIKPEELIAGLYDEARVTCALVDYINLPATLAESIILIKGRVGQVIIYDTYFTFELRSLGELLNKPLSYKVSPLCHYDFGDSRCQLNLATNNLFLPNLTVTAVANKTITLNTSLITSNFVNGFLVFSTGLNKAIKYEIASITGNNTVTITGELVGAIAVGNTLSVTAACGKTGAACKAYNNYLNFGGFAVGGHWIPGLDRIALVN